MQIDIEFDSCWQNSFLSGDDSELISRENKREFIATTKSKKNHLKNISDSTVLGILSRLIGDQRKLYQARESGEYCDKKRVGYYFNDIEDKITFKVEKQKYELFTKELVYLTNKDAKKIGESNFLDTIPNNSPWFYSKSSWQLWSILSLNISELLDFILSGNIFKPNLEGKIKPIELLHRISTIKSMNKIETLKKQSDDKLKMIEKVKVKIKNHHDAFEKKKKITPKVKEIYLLKKDDLESELEKLNIDFSKYKNDTDLNYFNDRLINAVEILDKKFPDKDLERSYLNNEIIFAMNLYSASLYLQAERNINEGIDLDYFVNNNHKIQGFSKRGFNGIRDFINPMTGNRKQAVGTPFNLTKATGKLEIIIDIDRERAKYIKTLIENAGVSSFYLGKKGLAYVSAISTREIQ